MHLWTDFARRASYVNSMGCAAPDVLLYNPIESGWVNVHAGMLDVGVWDILEGRLDGSRYHTLNKVYADAIADLTDARVEFLVGDRFYLKQMDVQPGKLVLGAFTFRTLVLPSLDILTLESARRMVAFANAGGRLYALGDLPSASAENGLNDPQMKKLMDELKATPGFSRCQEGLKSLLVRNAAGLETPVQFLSGEFKMLQQRRRIDGKDFFWLVNNAEQPQDCEVLVAGVKGRASIWDCETGEIRPVTSVDEANGSRVALNFKPLEAYWLVFDPVARAQVVRPQPALTTVLAIRDPWKVSFDAKAQPVMEFPCQPPAEFVAGVEKPLEDWKAWAPDKFSGLLDYTRAIEVEKVQRPMFLDLGKVCYAAEVWVNGKSVGQKLWGPYVFDVSKALHAGKNEIRVRVANLINNSYGDVQESGLFGPVTLQQAR
jgi:hypothetical protein